MLCLGNIQSHGIQLPNIDFGLFQTLLAVSHWFNYEIIPSSCSWQMIPCKSACRVLCIIIPRIWPAIRYLELTYALARMLLTLTQLRGA